MREDQCLRSFDVPCLKRDLSEKESRTDKGLLFAQQDSRLAPSDNLQPVEALILS